MTQVVNEEANIVLSTCRIFYLLIDSLNEIFMYIFKMFDILSNSAISSKRNPFVNLFSFKLWKKNPQLSCDLISMNLKVYVALRVHLWLVWLYFHLWRKDFLSILIILYICGNFVLEVTFVHMQFCRLMIIHWLQVSFWNDFFVFFKLNFCHSLRFFFPK